MAQVYSVNAVGYVNVDLKRGWQMIANPLSNQTGNTIPNLLPTVPEGTTIYKFVNGGYGDANGFEFGEWSIPTMELIPGEGVFLYVPADAPEKTTVTFVGEVKQGHLVTALPKGFAMVSSQVPQEGKVTTDLKYPAAEGDTIYTYDNAAGYASAGFEFGEWSPAEPVVKVAQAFWSYKGETGADWVRDFSVNQ